MIIYEPSGRAREYAELAANLYRGCDHACEYCFAPLALKTTREAHRIPQPRKDIIRQFAKEAQTLRHNGEKRYIQLSFTCDPYMQLDVKHQLTRQALQILFANNLNIAILTKGGRRSERDFDLLAANNDKVKYGATLVFADDADALKIEPGAAPTSERIASLKKAHDLGIRTWVSLEPIYHADDAYALIERTRDFVDIYKVGKLNYLPEVANKVNWREFAINVELLLKASGKEYYLKNDLRRFL